MAKGMAVLHGMAEKLLRGGLYQWVSPHRCRGAIHWELLGLGACEMLGQVLLEPGAGDATLCVGLPPLPWTKARWRLSGQQPHGSQACMCEVFRRACSEQQPGLGSEADPQGSGFPELRAGESLCSLGPGEQIH